MSDTPMPEGQGRATLALIAGIPLTMILAASWLWYFVVQGDLDLIGAIGTANNGVLLNPPRQIGTVAFDDDTGADFAWQDLDRRWTMLIPVSNDQCDMACERRLYFTRQIHIALGRDFKRVQRVLVAKSPVSELTVSVPDSKPEGWPDAFAGNSLKSFLELGHQGLVALSTDDAAFEELFEELVEEPNQWYLVDQAGWVMMRFDDSLDYKSVMSDLKFLLKNSGGA